MQDDLARQREREARQARDMSREALARGDVEGANRILDTFIDQQDPTQLSRDILSGSNNLRRILGLPQRPVDRLSGQITALSLDAYRDLTGSALAQLGDAAGGGAFSVDDGSTRANGADALPRGDAFPDPGAALIQTENGFADIAANWDEMSTFGQLASMASILVAMAAVAESDGRPIPPSLVDGTFAANVTALAEAAAGGNFRFGDEVDAYTARADIVEEEITLQRVAANARAEEKAAAEAAARQAELKRVEEEGKRLSEEIARWIAEPPKQIGIKPSASDTNFLPILRGVDANRCVTLYRPPYSSPVENTLLRTLTGSAMRDVIQINAYFVNTCDRKVSCEVTSIVSKISGEILTQRINFDDYSLTSGYRRHIIGIAPQDFIDYGSCRF